MAACILHLISSAYLDLWIVFLEGSQSKSCDVSHPQIQDITPLAILTKTSDPTLKLREVATVLESIQDNQVKANLMTATSVFGGLVLKPELIKTILRSEIMKESAVYQEILG